MKPGAVHLPLNGPPVYGTDRFGSIELVAAAQWIPNKQSGLVADVKQPPAAKLSERWGSAISARRMAFC